jgi:ribosome-binding ATPase
LGIIGLPLSGKSTVFRALTGVIETDDRKGHNQPGLGVVKIRDERLEFLTEYHKPKKVTPVHVEYLDIAGLTGEGKPGRELGDRILTHIRALDALVLCLRFFESEALGAPDPVKDYHAVQEEMIISDLAIVEKRIERLEKDIKKGRKELAEELGLLKEAGAVLEDGKALRTFPPAMESERLKGFAFLSAKPQLLLLNAGEDKNRKQITEALENLGSSLGDEPCVVMDWLYADSEAEIARLDEDDAKEFLEELELDEGARDRITRTSFDLLQLIVFFTVGEPEARAWQLRKGMNAVKAAGAVHSDMERGFIRAEVVAFDDFKEMGSMPAAQKAGKVRLEGKDYPVQDGDIILFRFNV